MATDQADIKPTETAQADVEPTGANTKKSMKKKMAKMAANQLPGKPKKIAGDKTSMDKDSVKTKAAEGMAGDQTLMAKDFMKKKIAEALKLSKDFGAIDVNDKSDEKIAKICESASTFISTMRMGKIMRKELVAEELAKIIVDEQCAKQ